MLHACRLSILSLRLIDIEKFEEMAAARESQ